MTTTVEVGAAVRISGTYRNALTGAAQDPTTPQLLLKSPAGVVSDVTAGVVHGGAGAYYYDLVVAEAGVTTFQWGSMASGEQAYSAKGQVVAVETGF